MDIHKLSKPLITLYKPQDTRKFCSFTVPNNKAGYLHLDTKSDTYGSGYRFITELKNRFGKLLGFEQFTLFDNDKKSTGLLISVEQEYRNKKYYFGEILRLASIIDIIENKLNAFEIYSKSTAIYFHSKYKFKSAITSFDERDNALNAIIANQNSKYKDLAEQAKELLYLAQTSDDGKFQRMLCVQANKIINQYIQKVIQNGEYTKHPFNWGMTMKLTTDNIKANREYFNALFQKHGIDYQI